MIYLAAPLAWLGRTVLEVMLRSGRFAIFSFRVLCACFSAPFYPRELARQIVRIGFLSLPVVGMTAVFVGAALALNIYVGGSRFNAESFVPNIVVLGITRELGPVLAGLMFAGRVSAGIAAEIGAMRVTEQIDAMYTLSAKPEHFLFAPRVLAATLTLPLLVLVADIIGVMGGYMVSIGPLGFNGVLYLRNTLDFMTTDDVVTGLVKAAVFGAIVSLMGCYHGNSSTKGAGGVGRAATLAVVWGAILLLSANYVLTSIFVQGARI